MLLGDLKEQLKAKDLFTDILGQRLAKRQLASGLLMNRHIIITGPSGIGKTTIAKNVAKLLPEISVNDCEFNCIPESPLCPRCRSEKKYAHKKISGLKRFVRLQGSPDLTVEDILGDVDPIKALKYGPASVEAFTPGKLFKANNGILFFDEINRCPEKLQNSLLQVLEEGKATIGSYSFDFPANFIFIGTMNPDETSATERLSDVFLDRFDVVHMTYPESIETEKEIVLLKGKRLPIELPDRLLQLALLFIRNLREHKELQKKPSVRASIGLYERAQANAFLSKRKEVTAGDIAMAVIPVISHRIELKPSLKYLKTKEEFIEEEFESFCKEHEDFKGGCL